MGAVQPQSYADMATLLTMAGATVAVVLVTNTVRRVTGWTSLFLPLGLALLFAFLAAQQSGGKGLQLALLTIVNGCMVFSASIGSNAAVIEAAGQDNPGAKQFAAQKPKWLSAWTTKLKL